MNRHIIGLYALALALGAAVLSACSANGTANSSPVPDVRRSWVEPVAKSRPLLYVSDIATNLVDIFTYPSGTKVGSLSGFGAVAGLCSDKAGDVFVVDEAGPVQMFAHGGTSPVRKLATSGAPYGCAIDPLTGNLALTNLSSYLYGALNIYRKAKGGPKQYNDPSQIDSTYFCAYDNSGNLYIDGWDRSAKFIFIKLRKGGTSLGVTKLNLKTSSPAGVQWDGTVRCHGRQGHRKGLPREYKWHDEGNRGTQERHQRDGVLARRLDTRRPQLLRWRPRQSVEVPGRRFTDQDDQRYPGTVRCNVEYLAGSSGAGPIPKGGSVKLPAVTLVIGRD